MQFALKSALVFSLIAAGAFACSSKSDSSSSGDDDSGGGGSVDIDADLAEKDLADLEDDDKTAICEALNTASASAAEGNKGKACALTGLLAAGEDADQDACEEAVTECEDSDEAPEAKEVDCDAFAKVDLADCEGTVQDYVDCLNDQLAAQSEIEVPACSDIDSDTKIDLSVETPKSCESFFKKCSALGGGTPSGDDDDTSGDDTSGDDTTTEKDSGTTPPKTDAGKDSGT